MSSSKKRSREHPGSRFSERLIEQDLEEVGDQLKEEGLTDGHNQIELYRNKNTTISLFVFDEGANLPEHSVDDGSVFIQVLQGQLCFQTEEAEDHLHPEEEEVLILESGLKHSVQAEEASRMLVTIMR